MSLVPMCRDAGHNGEECRYAQCGLCDEMNAIIRAAHNSSSDKKETPRTDAALRHQGSKYHDVIIRCERLIECSRQLERELTEAEDAITNWYVAAAPYATPETLNEALSARSESLAARRYERLRILGCAPSYSKHLENGTVLRFTGLDEFVDEDLRLHKSRGEYEDKPSYVGEKK